MMKRRSFDGSLGEGDSTAAAAADAAVCRICNRHSCCCCCYRLWKVLFVVARIWTISQYGFAVWFVGAHMVVGERRRRRGCGLLKLVATHSIDVCASWGEWRWHVSVIGRRGGRRRRRGSECEHFFYSNTHCAEFSSLLSSGFGGGGDGGGRVERKCCRVTVTNETRSDFPSGRKLFPSIDFTS